jgi:hypothetical protein
MIKTFTIHNNGTTPTLMLCHCCAQRVQGSLPVCGENVASVFIKFYEIWFSLDFLYKFLKSNFIFFIFQCIDCIPPKKLPRLIFFCFSSFVNINLIMEQLQKHKTQTHFKKYFQFFGCVLV